jgi:hypothetical protein
MSTSPVLDIFSVTIAKIKSNSLSISISIKQTEKDEIVETLTVEQEGNSLTKIMQKTLVLKPKHSKNH